MIDLLPLLDGVRETGPGKYMARCPAHDDNRPSLAVKITSEPKTLLHCFAGCDSADVVSALGLTFADLGPPQDYDATFKRKRSSNRPRNRAFVTANDALIAINHYAIVVAVIGSDLLEHREIDEETWELLAKSVERIGAARDMCCPARHRP